MELMEENMKVYNQQIKVDRESVCMADDVTAPNEKILDLEEGDKLSDVLKKVAGYLPQMSDVVWAVDSGKKVVGYIILDGCQQSDYELCEPDSVFSKMEIRALHCSYFHSRSFMHSVNGEMVEKYPERWTLLEKAKCSMQERFLDELRIKGGSICIWGEWFGRPYDNFHTVESVQWRKTEIVIHFDQGESLYIYNPANIINEEKRFVIGEATKVLFVWYYYGKEHTYDNLYVRQYIKDADGNLLRAAGKRRDVRNGEGIAWKPLGEVALSIG